MIIDGCSTCKGCTAPFVFFIVAALVTEVLFIQFFVLLCNGLSIADKDV